MNYWRYSRADLATPAFTEPAALGWVQQEISGSRNANEGDDGKDLQPARQQQEENNCRNTANDPTSTFRHDSLRDLANVILPGPHPGVAMVASLPAYGSQWPWVVPRSADIVA